MKKIAIYYRAEKINVTMENCFGIYAEEKKAKKLVEGTGSQSDIKKLNTIARNMAALQGYKKAAVILIEE